MTYKTCIYINDVFYISLFNTSVRVYNYLHMSQYFDSIFRVATIKIRSSYCLEMRNRCFIDSNSKLIY